MSAGTPACRARRSKSRDLLADPPRGCRSHPAIAAARVCIVQTPPSSCSKTALPQWHAGVIDEGNVQAAGDRG